MTTKVGTLYYLSPEVLQGNYDQSCDIWSLGVILYVLLCGVPPFYGTNYAEIVLMVTEGKFDFEPEEFENVSESCKNLIKCLIAP